MEGSNTMPHTSRALVATSRSLDPSIGIVVCIPCFRRPQHLRLTLESLANQRTDRRFAVVIVENDAMGCQSVPAAAAGRLMPRDTRRCREAMPSGISALFG